MLTKSAKASVAMMCISIVLVLLLCFGFSWRRRDGESTCPLGIIVYILCHSCYLSSLLLTLYCSSRETEVSQCVRNHTPSTCGSRSKGQGVSEH